MKKHLRYFSFASILSLTMMFLPQTAWAVVNFWNKNDEQAQQYYLEKNFEKALDAYQNFPTDEKHKPLLWHNMAMLKSHLGEKDAESFFHKAIKKIQQSDFYPEKKEQLAKMYYNLAHHYFSYGFYEKAANMYRENLKLFPNNTLARHHLELALLRKQKNNQQKKDNSKKKRSKKSTEKTKAQQSKQPPSQQEKNKKNDLTKKNQQQKTSSSSKQKSKFSRQDAKRILKKIQQTDANKKDLRVYREVINAQSSEKQW